MGTTMKAAIVGTGFMAQQHSSRLKGMADVAVRGVCSRSMESAAQLKEGQQLDSAELFTDFTAMLDRVKPDILYFCIPPYAHNGEVELAASRGIHLFLEKPIAIDTGRAESMVSAIEKAGVCSQVGFHQRFRTSVRKFKTAIDNGEAGKPSLFQGRFWCNMTGKEWWHTKAMSGGQLFEQLIHLYDLSLFLFGAPASANGHMANLCHNDPLYTIEDTSAGTVRFRNGSMASITGSNCAIPDHFIFDFRAVSEKMALDYRSTGDWRIKDESTLYRYGSGTVEEEKFTEDGDVYRAETEDFINAIRSGGKTMIPARAGLNAIRTVTAVINSAEHNGNSITL